MKKILLAALLLTLTLTTTAVSAQKSGRIRIQEVIMALPETTKMQSDLEAIRKDFADNLETMQSELNAKIAEYQQNESTMNASVRSLKEADMQDLDTRMRQFEQSAMQEIQARQNEMIAPIIEKVRGAVAEAAKAGGYTVVYDQTADALVYYDEAVVTDLTPAVMTRLNLAK